jgi:hypothetical protein
MYCSRCGAQNPSEAAFCIHCGTALEIGTIPRTHPHVTLGPWHVLLGVVLVVAVMVVGAAAAVLSGVGRVPAADGAKATAQAAPGLRDADGRLASQATEQPAQQTSQLSPVTSSTPTPAPRAPALALAGTAVSLSGAAIGPDNATSIELLARWGKGVVESVAYSPDGTLLAVGSSLGVYLYDSRSLSGVRHLQANGATSIAFSPDGATLASGGEDSAVCLWRVSDGVLLRTLEGHTD